jgi:hypothetical protein
MLSYDWDLQQLAIRIFEGLMTRGIPVWMDIMGGIFQDVNDALAEGVGGAVAICPLINSKYQDSAICNKELHHAASTHVPIMPILAQTQFIPTGWLDVILPTLQNEHASGPESAVQRQTAVPQSSCVIQEGMDDGTFEVAVVQLVELLKPVVVCATLPKPASAGTRRLSNNDLMAPMGGSFREWLVSLGFQAKDVESYLEKFDAAGLDCVQDMFAVQAEDLLEMGVKKFHAKKILDWIQEQREQR